MDVNLDEDTRQPRAVRKSGNRQKGKSTNRQAKPASATPSVPENSTGDAIEEENTIMTRIAKAKEELKVLQAQKDILAKEVTDVSTATRKIGRPRGVSIQVGMGLSDNKPKYDAIRIDLKRLVKDLCGEVGMNWESSWADIPAAKKAKLYQAAREEAPYLKRFTGDWPTQALAMQLLKNKRAHSYRRGYLEVPERYAYLKETAAKRVHSQRGSTDPTPTPESPSDGSATSESPSGGSDGGEPSDVTTVASGSKRKAPAAAQQPRKKPKVAKVTKNTRSAARQAAKGKGKKIVEAEDASGSETHDDEVDVEEE